MIVTQLKNWLIEQYNFEEDCTLSLLRSYTNDVYLVTSSNEKYVLKLYNSVWRTETEILWEVDLTEHLLEKGVLVPNVLTAKSGKKVVDYNLDGENLFVVVFDYAVGKKPLEPFTPELYYSVGQAAAKLHESSNDFSSQYSRPEWTLEYVIDNSLITVKDIISPETYNFISEFGSKLKTKIKELNEEGLDWGLIHGDLTLDNLHVDDDGSITLYDFDSSGLGFRAMDLQGWVVLHPDKKTNVDAYLRGYKEVRETSENDIKASPYLYAALDMWFRKGMKTLKDPTIFKQQMEGIKVWADYFDEKKLL